ncbi:MLP-like protein 31 isoform X9 [Arachis ipaensis]|uniref:MLP-like protein 43 n=1 Tax=Arachis hypogaea TaxID=3818 RepID=UPI0007AFB8EB|nr:MLP-like protein 31 isoform X9 [Arachis ipaensis]XP_025667138.1 MLP-like protein 31 isoform X2 [Arachis hypogaea]
MAISGKISVEVVIQVPVSKFFHILAKEFHNIQNICERVHEGNLHEDGKVITFKEKIEGIHEEKKLIKYSIFDGDIGQNYKLFKSNVQVTETNNESASVKWTIEYEKINEDVKTPYSFLEFLERSTIEVGDHLHKA